MVIGTKKKPVFTGVEVENMIQVSFYLIVRGAPGCFPAKCSVDSRGERARRQHSVVTEKE
jgi:hypothetical protein